MRHGARGGGRQALNPFGLRGLASDRPGGGRRAPEGSPVADVHLRKKTDLASGPSQVMPSLMSHTPIMPMSSCSMMWQ